MDKTYERFEELCKEKGVTAYRVSKDTGITTATLSNWKGGRYTPKASKLKLIADYFGVSVDYILNGDSPVFDYEEEETEEYNREMHRLIALLRNADAESLRTLTAYIEGYLAARRERS